MRLVASAASTTTEASPGEPEQWEGLSARLIDENPFLRDLLMGPMAFILSSYWLSQCLYVLAKLKVYDILAVRAMTVREIAAAVDADPTSLYRVLRALAGQGPIPGVVIEVFPPPDLPFELPFNLALPVPPLPFGLSHTAGLDDLDRRYALTPLGALLRSDMEGGIYPWAIMSGEEMFGAWGSLLEGVKTGKVPFELSTGGSNLWEFYNERPDKSVVFDRAMASFSETNRSLGGVIGAFDFTYGGEVTNICDVGGGSGLLLAGLLGRQASLQGVLFDRPEVFASGKPQAYLGEKGLLTSGPGSRITLAEGSFFDAQTIPQGCDAYVMKNIIHDWDDADSATILGNARKALPPGGRILLLEMLVGDDMSYNVLDNADFSQWFDLNMLVAVGGKERTRQEFERLFEMSGLELRKVTRGTGPAAALCVIEAVDATGGSGVSALEAAAAASGDAGASVAEEAVDAESAAATAAAAAAAAAEVEVEVEVQAPAAAAAAAAAMAPGPAPPSGDGESVTFTFGEFERESSKASLVGIGEEEEEEEEEEDDDSGWEEGEEEDVDIDDRDFSEGLAAGEVAASAARGGGKGKSGQRGVAAAASGRSFFFLPTDGAAGAAGGSAAGARLSSRAVVVGGPGGFCPAP